jgi:hypothetical protein
MPHYTLTNIAWESMKEEFGDDTVYFRAIGISDEDPKVRLPLTLPYRQFIRHATLEHPMIPSILDKARKHISAWGPQDSAMIRELAVCGFNITELAKKAFEEFYDLEEEAKRQAALNANRVPLEEIVNELEALVPEIKKETINYYQLCESLEKVISNEVVGQFPIIINSSPEHIRELKHILVKHVSSLSDDLLKLIEKAQDAIND